MRRTFAYGLLLVAALLAGAFYWLFYDNRPPSVGTFPLDVAELRKEVQTIPGTGPERIEVETLYGTAVPRIAMITGTSWDEMQLVRNSYRLVFADASIIVDTGNDEAMAMQDSRTTYYDPAAWKRAQLGLDQASAIVVTHEHGDHVGGLLQSPNWRSLLQKALLNPEQVQFSLHDEYWPKNWRDGVTPFSYQGIKAVAPGVVLIRAPGHTKGSQMVYVRRADGREFIFMGDTATSLDNVRLIRPRSRYVMISGTHGDERNAVFLQTMALNRLMTSIPDLVLVPGHDAAAIQKIEQAGLLTRGFTKQAREAL